MRNCSSSCLFGIFIIKESVVFSLTSFDTLKCDFVIKTREMFSFLHLMNNSVTIELSFLLLRKSAIIPSKTINVLRFLFGLYSSMFYKYYPYY